MNMSKEENILTSGKVTAVSRSPSHLLSKLNQDVIALSAGLGVENDAHMGVWVKHRSRVAGNPRVPNLRQVHLLHDELFEELAGAGFRVKAGELGENITTHGIDLLGLPLKTRLHIGESTVIEVTGLRNPCAQLDRFLPGLMRAVLDRDAEGNLIRKAGIMAIVTNGGDVKAGDSITVELPDGPHLPLGRV
jgi:MOSC domain